VLKFAGLTVYTFVDILYFLMTYFHAVPDDSYSTFWYSAL